MSPRSNHPDDTPGWPHWKVTDSPDYFYLRSVAHGTVLMPKDALDDNGTPLRLFTVEDAPSVTDTQLWTLTEDGLLVNKSTSGLCTAGGTAPGSPVTQEEVRLPLRKRQRWYFNYSTFQVCTLRGKDLVLAATRKKGEVVLQAAQNDPGAHQQWERVAPHDI